MMLHNATRPRIVKVLATCLVAVAASMIVNAHAHDTPESRTRDFYSWYLKARVNGKDPTRNKKITSSYLSVRFSRWFYSKAVRNADTDVFIDSEEWHDAWADNIEIGAAVITGNSAALHIMFSSPPDESVMKLQVSLVKEAGKWKIDRVRGLFE